MKKQRVKVSAIIPAYNEEKNILNVLKVIQDSCLIDEIIVVDDGSEDKTSKLVKNFSSQIKLLRNKKNKGKGYSLLRGAQNASNPLLFFCDADLTSLKQKHLEELILPVQALEVEMTVGIVEKLSFLSEYDWYKKLFPIEKEKGKFINGLGGQRAIWKKDFLQIKGLEKSGYGVENMIMHFFIKNKKTYKNVILRGMGHIYKVKKWGIKGVFEEAKALRTLAWQYLKYYVFKV